MSARRGRMSIRRTLWLGMGSVGLLLLASGGLGWWSARAQTAAVQRSLGALQHEIDLTLRLSTGIAQELLAAERYLDGERSARESFDQLGFEVRRAYHELGRLAGHTTEDVRLVAAMMRDVADAEAHYAVAHRLRDLGRAADAEARAARAAPHTRAALAALVHLGDRQQRTLARATAELTGAAERRLGFQLAVLAGALLLAALVARQTIRSVAQPLAAVVAHARRLSEGDLTARTRAEALPGEFGVLAAAMNRAADTLAQLAGVVAATAGEVSQSANTVAAGAEQITATAGEVAHAMARVAEGAEAQVAQLREVDGSLAAIGSSAHEVRTGAEAVEALADAIRHSAEEKRHEVGRSVEALQGVLDAVYTAAAEVDSLREETAQILRFVDLVSGIAGHSELLALNAAIEAARAGEHGRSFGVVANEVRSLAEQTQTAAREVVQTTRLVTGRIDSAAHSMAASVTRVGEIERLSQQLDGALGSIAETAARTRAAADGVASVAEQNTGAVAAATRALAGLAQAAEDYAAAAQEVGASTEEQSAACEEVSAIAAELLVGSDRLQDAVRQFRVGAEAAPYPAAARSPALALMET